MGSLSLPLPILVVGALGIVMSFTPQSMVHMQLQYPPSLAPFMVMHHNAVHTPNFTHSQAQQYLHHGFMGQPPASFNPGLMTSSAIRSPVFTPIQSSPFMKDLYGFTPKHLPYTMGQCSPGTRCVTYHECPDFEKYSTPGGGASCSLYSSQVTGVCCPLKDITHTSIEETYLKPMHYYNEGTMSHGITYQDIGEAIKKAQLDRENLMNLEMELQRRNLVAGGSSTDERHHHFFSNPVESKNESLDGFLTMRTTIELVRRFKLDPRKIERISLLNTPLRVHCLKSVTQCSGGKYRTTDGSCNNAHNPTWGKSFIPYNRLMPADYGDGVNSPRLSSRGRPLPNPRVISVLMSPETKSLSKFFSHVLMQWGQFMDHDMTRTAIQRTFTGAGIQCCNEAFTRNPKLLHPSCFPIDVPVDDPFYSRFNSTCMSFVRSAAAPSVGCTIGPREQMNQVTAYIDASMIYGSTADVQTSLRTFEGGLLVTSTVDGRDFIPTTSTIPNCNIPPDAGLQCFLSGDNRVNMQVSLITLTALFHRNHNRIAGRLSVLNPSWSDEVLYQETKKIVSSQIQHITYNEYLPLILGKKVMDAFDLILSNDLTDVYDATTNSGMMAAFSGAAFRLHTTVRSTIPFRDNQNRMIGQLDLSDTFLNPSVAYTKDAYPEMLNGLTGGAMTKFDRFFSTELTRHLFRQFNASFGLDLVALNINRGRDHGLPSYNKWRHLCGLPTIDTFAQLSTVMDAEAAKIISILYHSVDDIDLFVAGTSEYHIKGAIVGPTFACIIAEQFRRLKFGDKFWYENGHHEGALTSAQLQEIKRTTIASVFCTEPELSHVQKLAFIRPFDDWNPRVSCEHIPQMDLKPWTEYAMWKK